MVKSSPDKQRKTLIPSPRRLARLWPRVRPYRRGLILAGIALVLSSALGLAFPQVVRILLDAAFEEGNRTLLDRIALGLVALFSVQALLNYAQAYLLAATGERAVAGFRRELFTPLPETARGCFAGGRTGALTIRPTTD